MCVVPVDEPLACTFSLARIITLIHVSLTSMTTPEKWTARVVSLCGEMPADFLNL